MAHQTAEVATREGHGRDLDGLHGRRDRRTRAHDRRGVEDARVDLVGPHEEQGGLAEHLHVVPTALGEDREAANRRSIARNGHVRGANRLVRRVEGQPLTVDERHRVGGRGQRGVGENEVPTVNRKDVRNRLEVDFLKSGHVMILLGCAGLTTSGSSRGLTSRRPSVHQSQYLPSSATCRGRPCRPRPEEHRVDRPGPSSRETRSDAPSARS